MPRGRDVRTLCVRTETISDAHPARATTTTDRRRTAHRGPAPRIPSWATPQHGRPPRLSDAELPTWQWRKPYRVSVGRPLATGSPTPPVERACSRDAVCRSPGGWIWLPLQPFLILLGNTLAPGLHPAALPITWGTGQPDGRRAPGPDGGARPCPTVMRERPATLIVADKGLLLPRTRRVPRRAWVKFLRPSYRNRTPNPAQHVLNPVRRLIETPLRTNSTWNAAVDALPTEPPPAPPPAPRNASSR